MVNKRNLRVTSDEGQNLPQDRNLDCLCTPISWRGWGSEHENSNVTSFHAILICFTGLSSKKINFGILACFDSYLKWLLQLCKNSALSLRLATNNSLTSALIENYSVDSQGFKIIEFLFSINRNLKSVTNLYISKIVLILVNAFFCCSNYSKWTV